MEPNLRSRVQSQGQMIRKIDRLLGNIEQRLAFLEVKMDTQIQHTQNGNGTRNLIALAIIVKFVLEAGSQLPIEHLMKLLGG